MADVRGVAERHAEPTVRALVRLAIAVTEAPWALSARDLERAADDGVDAARVLHAVLQSALFGHLNRIADAVDVDADYPDDFGAPHVAPATAPYATAPRALDPAGRALDPGAMTGVGPALAAWREHALDRETPMSRRERAVIAAAVARALGDAGVAAAAPATPREHVLAQLADTVARAPWRLGPPAYAPVRDAGLAGDADVFDAVATASACTVFSRIGVALAALAS